MGEIVGFDGRSVAPSAAVSAAVVAFAEDLLMRARAGDVIGLCVSLHHVDGSHSYRYEGRATLATIGNVERLKVALCRDFDEGSETSSAS